MKEWVEEILYREKLYKIRLRQRPFREGLEAELLLPEATLKVAELGLGREALQLKIEALIDKYLNSQDK